MVEVPPVWSSGAAIRYTDGNSQAGEHFDVLIVGAGISGIGYEFKPWRSEYAIAYGAKILDYIHEAAGGDG